MTAATSVAVLGWGPADWPLTVSTVERAILELLDEVPQVAVEDHGHATADGQ